jgi:hypothetical protein
MTRLLARQYPEGPVWATSQGLVGLIAGACAAVTGAGES